MVKLVVISRKKFPDQNKPGILKTLRRGKEIAQACHASRMSLDSARSPAKTFVEEWYVSGCTTISLVVESEEELIELANAAKQANLPYGLVKDSGRTEFAGVDTLTALGIGPYDSEEIDKITKHLPLY